MSFKISYCVYHFKKASPMITMGDAFVFSLLIMSTFVNYI